MNQPNFTQIDERLRAVLVSAMQRDPNVLRNADHLHALLADLAPDMPVGLRNACVAVVRTNATSWLTQSPPYSEEQVVAWLRSQFPDLTADVSHQAVAAIAQLSAAPPAPAQPAAPPVAPPVTPLVAPLVAPPVSSPVFDQPTVAGSVADAAAPPSSFPPASGYSPVTSYPAASSAPTPPASPVFEPPSFPPPTSQPTGTDRPTVGSMLTEMPVHPSFPPNQGPPQGRPLQGPPVQGSWPPPPPPPANKGRRTAIILAVVAVLLVAAGVGAFFVFSGGDDAKPLAAPANVSTKLDGFGGVEVSWAPVKGADHYTISDLSGGIDPTDVTATSHVFAGAAAQGHRFVVVAVDSGGKAGTKSAPEVWVKQEPLGAPDSVSVTESGNALEITWTAVDNATGYELRDSDDPSFAPDTITATHFSVPDSVYASHIFTVKSLGNGESSPAASETYTPTNELSADEATLAYKLTSSMVKVGSCSADSADEDKSIYVSAAVSCDPTGAGPAGPPVVFALQLKQGTQNAFEKDHFGDFESRVGCENSYPDAGTQSTWELSNKTIGDEFCFRASNGTSVFAWTYYDDNVCIQIEGGLPATRTGLHGWWGNHVTLLQ